MNSTRGIERELKRISQRVEELRKKVIVRKSAQSKGTKAQLDAFKRWEELGKRVSAKWKGPDAVEEIRLQREKTW